MSTTTNNEANDTTGDLLDQALDQRPILAVLVPEAAKRFKERHHFTATDADPDADDNGWILFSLPFHVLPGCEDWDPRRAVNSGVKLYRAPDIPEVREHNQAARQQWEAQQQRHRELWDEIKTTSNLTENNRLAGLVRNAVNGIIGDVEEVRNGPGWSDTLYLKAGQLAGWYAEGLLDQTEDHYKAALFKAAHPWNTNEEEHAETHINNGWDAPITPNIPEEILKHRNAPNATGIRAETRRATTVIGGADGVDAGGGGGGPETDSNAPPQYGDPKQYFEKDGLQVRDLADDVMSTITTGYGASDGRLYVYEHGLWVPDDGRIQAEITARLGNRYRKMHSSNVLDVIKFTPGILRITCDPVPDYINVRNGMVDWRKDKLLPHDPKYLSTVQLPVTYDPDAKCPRFDRFLADVLPADCIEFMWELIAYTIYSGNPFHIAVMLYGKGRNGKGTLMRVLKALLGSRNTSSVTLYELMDNRFRSATLYGKLANLAGDLDGRWLDNTAIFKALTGGDTIQGEIKHGAIFDFVPWALPFYSMNKPFSSADSSEGWWARWVVVPFPNSFVGKENRTLDNVLQTDAELSGILAHALRVLPALMARGRLSEPASVRQAKKGFIASSDTLRHFVSENCELDPNAWTERGSLYRAYARHAVENGAKQMSNREFYNRIEQIGGVSEKRKTDGRGFQGIKLIGQPLGGEPLVP